MDFPRETLVKCRLPFRILPRWASHASFGLAWLAFGAILAGGAPLWAARGEFELAVLDKDTGLPIAVRMHLKDARGRPVSPRGAVLRGRRLPPAGPGAVLWNDHFVFAGRIVLSLLPGRYTFELERGPEYRVRHGNFEIRSGAKDAETVTMIRFVDMRKENWYSGDLHVHRPVEDIRLLMLAEDLRVAPVITWWNKRNPWSEEAPPKDPLTRFDEDRFYHVLAGEDEREGGALLYFNLDKPLEITEAEREYPSPATFLERSREFPNTHVDVEKPFWWDAPTWVATGQVDSIGLAHNHMHRSGVLDGEAWGKPRDKALYPGPTGNGRWTTHIYYQMLNAGLRIPPSAGSASGVLPNPVGYNRVYVHVEGEFTYAKWFEGLREGRVVVTNGPMLRPRVNGELPGHVFKAEAGEEIELSIQLNLALRDKVEYLEVVRDGKVVHEVRLSDYAKARGRLPTQTFQQSGWLLVRAVTNNAETYRFASTGPYYVQVGGQPRISRSAAAFFRDWVDERMSRIKVADPARLEEVLKPHRQAKAFWSDRIDRANAD